MEMIRYKLKQLMLTALLPVLLFCSCKKDTVSATSEPVVQAYLIPGNAITVKLYAQKSLTDTAQYGAPITGQKLSVSDGTTTVQLTETARGVYTYADTSFLVSGKTYSLSFNYNAVTVSAKTTMPVKAQNFATQYINVNYTAGTATNGLPDTIN